MNGTWVAWGAIALALASSAMVGAPVRATAVVALAGCALAGPARWRVAFVALIVAVAWGGWRAAQLDESARPVRPQPLHGAIVVLHETLPKLAAGQTRAVSARGGWDGRRVVVSVGPYARAVPTLRRGWVIAVDGRLVPLGDGPGDRRLADDGVAGRMIVTAARDTHRRRGGVIGALDQAANRTAIAAQHAAGPRAGPLLVGMSLGTAEEISGADRDALQASGLWHLAAASGGNIALVVTLCFAIGWLLGVPDRARIIGAIAAVALYVPLAGNGPSIQRAGVMGGAALSMLLLGRTHRTADALGLAAAATIAIDPRAWLDVGWQLSFAATAGLLLAVQPCAQWLAHRSVPRPLALALATTAVATLATAPIALLRFGAVSAIGLLTNVAAAPLAAVSVWSGTLASVASAWSPSAAHAVAIPGAGAARLTLAIAEWGAARGHAQLDARTVAGVLIAAGVLLVLRPGRRVGWALVACMVVVLTRGAPGAPSTPRLVVLDVGQGSAALLQSGPDAILIDTGPADGGVVRQLRRAGVRRLRAVLVSHPAADHDGGAAAVLDAFPTDLLLDGGTPGGGPTHAAALRAAARHDVRVVPVRAGQTVRVGEIAAAVRWPTAAGIRAAQDPNDRAAVVDATVGGLRVLLPADAEGNVLTKLTPRADDVLVVSHHGSADPALPAVLRRVRPALAVISVGAHNSYRHPRPQTLAALRAAGIPTLRTDEAGNIAVWRDGTQLRVQYGD